MPNSDVNPVRWSPVYNNTEFVIPPFAVMAVEGIDDEGNIMVGLPTVDGQTDVLFNDNVEIEPDEYGQGRMAFPLIAAYEPDEETDADPLAGEIWGAEADSFYLQSGQTGFKIIGDGSGGLVSIMPMSVAVGDTCCPSYTPACGTRFWPARLYLTLTDTTDPTINITYALDYQPPPGVTLIWGGYTSSFGTAGTWLYRSQIYPPLGFSGLDIAVYGYPADDEANTCSWWTVTSQASYVPNPGAPTDDPPPALLNAGSQGLPGDTAILYSSDPSGGNALTTPLSPGEGGTGIDGSSAAIGALLVGNGGGFTITTNLDGGTW